MELGATIVSASTVLLFVMDPFGNAPLALALLKDLPQERRRHVIRRELLIALGVLLGFLVLGQQILDLLGLEQESVTIAGGIVLAIIALRMIFPRADGIMGPQPGGEPFIVPLAIPLIAGPSAMATVILIGQGGPGALLRGLVAILVAWSITAATLLSAPALYGLLRDRGMKAVERLMGMLLVMIAVQMVLSGLESAF